MSLGNGDLVGTVPTTVTEYRHRQLVEGEGYIVVSGDMVYHARVGKQSDLVQAGRSLQLVTWCQLTRNQNGTFQSQDYHSQVWPRGLSSNIQAPQSPTR